jgi:hypothetical protein
MLSKKTLHFVWAVAIVALLIPAAASAQSSADQRTIFTFSQPVTIPGHTLPAGTYEFMVADTSDRHVIQVFQPGGTKILATVFAIPSLRSDRPSKAEVRFLEVAANMPQAMQTWWYVGETTGHEFIYPREQAKILAKTNPQGVLAGEGSGDVSRVFPSGEEKKVDSKAAESQPVTGKSVQGEMPKASDKRPAARAQTPPPAASQPEVRPNPAPDTKDGKAEESRKSLPSTASSRPIVLGLGAALLALGLALGFGSMAARRGRRTL